MPEISSCSPCLRPSSRSPGSRLGSLPTRADDPPEGGQKLNARIVEAHALLVTTCEDAALPSHVGHIGVDLGKDLVATRLLALTCSAASNATIGEWKGVDQEGSKCNWLSSLETGLVADPEACLGTTKQCRVAHRAAVATSWTSSAPPFRCRVAPIRRHPKLASANHPE